MGVDMNPRRFYVPPGRIHGGVAELLPDQVHRVREVLRLKRDSQVEVFDGKGNAYLGRLEFTVHGSLVSDLERIADREQLPPRLVVAAAMIKPARFEWMLEKATELGTDEFIPLITRHSDVHLVRANLPSRLNRWQRIVQQACEQSGRTLIPAIQAPLKFPDLLAMDSLSGFTRLLLYESGGLPLSREKPPGPAVICIGPEGGWDPSEVDAALERGYRLVSLGRHILRAETSAVAAIALLRIANCGSGTDE